MTVTGVLNYGAGNLSNIKRAIEYLGHEYLLVSSPTHFKKINSLIIPGVGAFPKAMQCLKESNLIEEIKRFASRNNPVLGICLGMHLLFEKGYEFEVTEGLGLLSGEVKSLPLENDNGITNKIPHVGWAKVKKNALSDEINVSSDIKKDNYFYFLHSFIALPKNKQHVIALSEYNRFNFPAIVGSEKIIGCQFHPEKSGENGLKFLSNFIDQKTKK